MGVNNIIVLLILTIVSVSSKPISIQNVIGIADLPALTAEEMKVVTLTENNRNELYGAALRKNNLRPGMDVTSYAVELTPNVGAGTFNGKLTAQVVIDFETREDEIILYVSDLKINSVTYSIAGASTFTPADFSVDDDDGTLEIDTGAESTLYTIVIEYTGSLGMAGSGLYAGRYDDETYVAMNLQPTNARRVFPCMDEPTESSIMSFTFNNMEYNNLLSNSLLEENSDNQFRALQGPPHLWSMMAHNLININLPITNVRLFGRPGWNNQEGPASVAINVFFNSLNEWTSKDYFEIILNQDGRLNIMALPDVSRDWYGLSNIGIWEPYVFMETGHSVKQRKTGLAKIAEAIAHQWFGYVIFPQNWRYQWVLSGLASYAGYEAFREFQSNYQNDVTLLDVNTLFVTDVIQEALLRDSYPNSLVLEPAVDLFDQDEIRDHLSGLIKYKAPALMRMFKLTMGKPNTDIIQSAARILLNARSLQSVNSWYFGDALRSNWINNGNDMIDDIGDYLEPWIEKSGYAMLTVGYRSAGVILTQERFSFSNIIHVGFDLPITYTTRVNPDFSDSKLNPVMLMSNTMTLDMDLGEDDWVLFNIQGQGYYRVKYDEELSERIILALEEPDTREKIHPLNRATLVDDALNLARAGRLDYDIAFRIVLTMEHETEYAVWKAFVRNMEFIRKRFQALIANDDDDDFDPDIYLRMVRRTITAFENELGFYPEVSSTDAVMPTLTRGLVMEHACKANYQPCIAAAVDWFYDPNDKEVVNPNIPHEIRPAVYCTMVKEGDEQVRKALLARLEIEVNHYERVVILESLACSRDARFIRELLQDTIVPNGPYGVEERVRIFKAVAESSYENADIAIDFMASRTIEIKDTYGGPEKLEELLFVLAENCADADLVSDFRSWIRQQDNNLDGSQDAAERALAQATVDLAWNNNLMDDVYEWIDENDASTLMLSAVALWVSLMVALLNN